jgi:hypothetical protein
MQFAVQNFTHICPISAQLYINKKENWSPKKYFLGMYITGTFYCPSGKITDNWEMHVRSRLWPKRPHTRSEVNTNIWVRIAARDAFVFQTSGCPCNKSPLPAWEVQSHPPVALTGLQHLLKRKALTVFATLNLANKALSNVWYVYAFFTQNT